MMHPLMLFARADFFMGYAYMILLIVLLIVAYLIGAIPTGYWLCRCIFGIDIRIHGSGNIGASNVARIVGKRYFGIVFLIDAFKAYGVLWFTGYVAERCIHAQMPVSFEYALAWALLVGNAYSVFLGWGGGKGVATSVGILWFMLPIKVVFVFMGLWIVIVGMTGQPFLASLLSFVVMMIGNYFFYDCHTLFLLGLFVWLCLRHTTNMKRYVENFFQK